MVVDSVKKKENDICVSITTPTFNCASTIARSVESVLMQTHRPLEHIILDGASTDNTVEVVEAYQESYQAAGISLKLISEPDNNMWEAINKGMDKANGEIIGNINGDDWYEPDAVSIVVDSFKSQPFDVCYGDLRIYTARDSFIKYARPMRWATTRVWNHPTMFLASKGLCYRYRTDIVNSDLDLFIRMKKDRCAIRIISETLASFNFGGMSTEKSLEKAIERIKSKNQVFHDNNCGPLSYIENGLIETLKYFKG